MAGDTTAEVRVYRTIDGELVKEGDPRGAFLAFGPGDAVPDADMKAYKELFDAEGGKASKAYTDDDARAELRERQAGQPPEHIGRARPQVGEKLATELADEARVVASRPVQERAEELERVDSDRVVTTRALWRTEKGDLVAEGDESGTTQAYAPGDIIQDNDVEAYRKLDESTQDDRDRDDRESTEDTGPGGKMSTAANKASTVRRSK